MTPKNQPDPATGNQRDALAESEKEAAEQQPRSYDERNVTDKKVHINPPDPKSNDAIKGIDPN